MLIERDSITTRPTRRTRLRYRIIVRRVNFARRMELRRGTVRVNSRALLNGARGRMSARSVLGDGSPVEINSLSLSLPRQFPSLVRFDLAHDSRVFPRNVFRQIAEARKASRLHARTRWMLAARNAFYPSKMT